MHPTLQIMHAIKSKNIDLVKTLKVEHCISGLETAYYESSYVNIFFCVIESAVPDIVRLFLEGDKYDKALLAKHPDALIWAVDGKSGAIADLLLAYGFDPEWKDGQGLSALGKANIREDMEMVRKFLAARQQHADDRTGWHKLSEQRIAHVEIDDTIAYRLTDIFNFKTRERTQVVCNLETNTETSNIKSFDEFNNKAVIEEAFNALRARGGKLDASIILSSPLSKPALR